jgi:hypothetical protein
MRVPVDAYSTLLVLPALDFPHERLNRRERGDPALEEGLDKLLHYVMGRGGLERMTAVKYGLWRHLQRTRHHVALFIDEAELDRLREWAEAANAVYLLPDGTIRDPFGRVLIGKEGSGDAHARIPFPADARARKARSEALLEARGITIFDGLPPVVGEGEVALRRGSVPTSSPSATTRSTGSCASRTPPGTMWRRRLEGVRRALPRQL